VLENSVGGVEVREGRDEVDTLPEVEHGGTLCDATTMSVPSHCAHHRVGIWPFGERINGILQPAVRQISSVRTHPVNIR